MTGTDDRAGTVEAGVATAQHAVRVNGVELAYLESGRPEDPLVLCLHGFPDSPAHVRAPRRASSSGPGRAWSGRGCGATRRPRSSRARTRSRRSPGTPSRSPTSSRPTGPRRWSVTTGAGSPPYGAAALAPHRWDRMVVLSVPPTRVFRPFLRADWDQQRASWYQFLFQLEPLAEAVVRDADFAFIDRLWESWSPGWDVDREALDAAKRSIRAGFPAALDFYRDTWQVARQDPGLADDQQRIVDGPVRVPTMVLHGLQDGCILPAAMSDAASYFAGGAPHRSHSRRRVTSCTWRTRAW